ncbi:hypothetical protein PRIPAC_71255, partial [Pristionchus pacificus]|uniref:Uncharacterized protein n=1 Tax=Pristionchus pacificus TaxID=54126 RepID=A0A2A6CT55_PRIPA
MRIEGSQGETGLCGVKTVAYLVRKKRTNVKWSTAQKTEEVPMKKTVALEPLLVMEEERVMIKEKKGLKTMERNTQNGLDERKKKEGSSDGRKERRRW